MDADAARQLGAESAIYAERSLGAWQSSPIPKPAAFTVPLLEAFLNHPLNLIHRLGHEMAKNRGVGLHQDSAPIT